MSLWLVLSKAFQSHWQFLMIREALNVAYTTTQHVFLSQLNRKSATFKSHLSEIERSSSTFLQVFIVVVRTFMVLSPGHVLKNLAENLFTLHIRLLFSGRKFPVSGKCEVSWTLGTTGPTTE